MLEKNNYFDNFSDEEVDFDGDRLLFKGKYFNGISVEKDKSGNILSEKKYVDGFEEGLAKEWYLNGKMKSETLFKRGRAIEKSCWFECGSLQSKSKYELGILLWSKTWDKNGKLVDEQSINESSSKLLEKLRKNDS